MTDKPWAIYTDLTGISDLGGNRGGFATAEEANDRLIEMLEGRRVEIADKLTNAYAVRREIRKGRPTYKVMLARLIRSCDPGLTAAEIRALHPEIPRGSIAVTLERLVADGTLTFEVQRNSARGREQRRYIATERPDEDD